jgi:hypothetical protein
MQVHKYLICGHEPLMIFPQKMSERGWWFCISEQLEQCVARDEDKQSLWRERETCGIKYVSVNP